MEHDAKESSDAVIDSSIPSVMLVGSGSLSCRSKDARHEAYLSMLSKWWSDDEEVALRKKIDMRLVTTTFCLFLCAILDRSNLGNAKLAGLERSLRMSDAQFQWLLTIFYIAYILFQFLILAYKIVPPRTWLSLCALTWGITGLCQAAVTSWEGLMVARFFLAVSESGFGAGYALYLTFFYPKTEIGLRFAIYVSAGTFAAAIAGSLAYAIVHAHALLESWRLLFLVEGIPTLVMAPIAYFVLPNSIQTASFLTAREKAIAEARLFRPPPEAMDNCKASPTLLERVREQCSLKRAVAVLTDPTTYISAILIFIEQAVSAALPVYVPTLVSEMGYGNIQAQGLAAPPYVLACLLSLVGSWLTDRYQLRGPMCTFFLLIGAVGYLMLACLRSTVSRYIGIWFVVNGVFPVLPILYMWLMASQDSESKKGIGLVVFATIGQCGPLLGTRLFPASEKPYYVTGTASSAAILLFAVLLSAGLSFRFWRINRRRDRQESLGTREGGLGVGETFNARSDSQEKGEAAGGLIISETDRRKIDVMQRGEDSPYFRYTL